MWSRKTIQRCDGFIGYGRYETEEQLVLIRQILVVQNPMLIFPTLQKIERGTAYWQSGEKDVLYGTDTIQRLLHQAS